MTSRTRTANDALDPVLSRLDRIEHQLARTHAIALRAYETAQGWPSILAEIRNAPDYELPFRGDPLITVRIATYNGAQVLCERALPSIIGQTYPNWEAIVVGDACTDDTEERVRGLGDERIRFVNLPFREPYPEDPRARWQVAGSQAMNLGMDLAKGAWIAALDHDDEFSEDHLEVLLRIAQSARAELAYGKLDVRDAGTGELRPYTVGEWPPRVTQFMFQGAIVHRGLGRFGYDLNAHLADEPGDWNLARRLWDAGVRFKFVETIVGTYWCRWPVP
jgi:glycosyltransferase involved in cell wall biosynthesis